MWPPVLTVSRLQAELHEKQAGQAAELAALKAALQEEFDRKAVAIQQQLAEATAAKEAQSVAMELLKAQTPGIAAAVCQVREGLRAELLSCPAGADGQEAPQEENRQGALHPSTHRPRASYAVRSPSRTRARSGPTSRPRQRPASSCRMPRPR